MSRWWVGSAAALALVMAGCVRDEVQRRPPDPRPDRLPPMQVESPPFAPDASANRDASAAQEDLRATRPGSAPVVEGRVVRVERDLIELRDDLGHTYRLQRTPDTRTTVALEEGANVRAAWQLVDEALVATELSAPAEDGATPAPAPAPPPR